MIHLFKKVYLLPDSAFTPYLRKNCLLISKNFTKYPISPDIKLFLRHSAATYDHLLKVTYGNSSSQLFEWLRCQSGEVYIYADSDAYTQIFLQHLAFLYPGKKALSTYPYYLLSVLKRKWIDGQRQPISISVSNSYDNVEILSEPVFKERLQACNQEYRYASEIHNSCAFELRLAAYLQARVTDVDLPEVFLREFERDVMSIVKETILWEVEDLKNNLLASLLDVHRIYGSTGKLLEAAIQAPQGIDFIFDRNCGPHNPECLDTYGVSYFNNIWTMWARSFNEYDPETFLAQLFHLASTEAIADDYIDFDMSWNCGSQLFGKSSMHMPVNTLFVSYIYAKYRDNDTILLDYSLVQ